MRYSFEFIIDSKDYLDFNIHTLKVYGLLKKQSISLRILLLAVMLIYIVIEVVNSAELSEKIISVIAIVFVFSIAQLLVSPVLMLCLT